MNGRDTLLPMDFPCRDSWRMAFLLTTSFPGYRWGMRRAAVWRSPCRAPAQRRRPPGMEETCEVCPAPRRAATAPSVPDAPQPHAPLLSPEAVPRPRHGRPSPPHPAARAGRFSWHHQKSGCPAPAAGGQPTCPPPETLGLEKRFEHQECTPGMDAQGLSSPEEKCLKMLLALRTLFPHSARYSTAVSEI